MKLSSIDSNKPSSSYDQASYDLIQLILLHSPGKSSHASKFTKHVSYMTLEGDTLLQIQKWWVPSFLDSSNTFQQRRSVRNTNILHNTIMNYLPILSHRTPILKSLKQNKHINHYPEHSEFILLKMKLLSALKHQNHMSG